MQELDGQRLYSPRDLVNFLGCAYCTVLDIRQLTAKEDIPADDPYKVLLQERGIAHEKSYLDSLKGRGLRVVEVPESMSLTDRVHQTIEAMRSGADVVYQGALRDGQWHGFSDFLLRTQRPSSLGDWAYDLADTKLSRKAKPSHLVQLAVYSDLLGKIQGSPAESLVVVLGDGREARIVPASIAYYVDLARRRFEGFASGREYEPAAEPCGHCAFCRWAYKCESHWDETAHLSRVANISRGQIFKLQKSGVRSVSDLAALGAEAKQAGINSTILERLITQARLQLERPKTGPQVALIPLSEGKGFNRLPVPSEGDVFFDMEGDPFAGDGLEYLFGLYTCNKNKEVFTPFWAHTRDEEKLAFQNTIDHFIGRLSAHPDAHIYHYAAYEVSAIKRLAMYHGTREAEVDDLLRQGRFVDLYKVVREAVRTSERGLSLKDLEIFYLEASRAGEVKSAMDSVLAYEAWRASQDNKILEDIRQYNELDCKSTKLCRDWLISLRPEGAVWKPVGELKPPTPAKIKERAEAEQKTQQLRDKLITGASAEDAAWKTLLGDLLEFHRREAKPSWWAMFERQEMADHELLEDAECLALLHAHPEVRPRREDRSTVYSFTFPVQDFKLRVGDEPIRAGSGEPAGEILSIDEATTTVEIKLGPSRTPLENGSSLIPGGPVGDKPLRDAVFRYAEKIAAQENRYKAVTDLLSLKTPDVAGHEAGRPILGQSSSISDVLGRLKSSYLVIQGPPGSGKTREASIAIAALLSKGARIGIASNSHKAINNLLVAVQGIADAQGLKVRAVKKSSREDQYSDCGMVLNTLDNKEACSGKYQLTAGTAWLFARQEMDSVLDYLFIDEAGQVSLANVIAMGVSAKNIVLIGDQMQLSQPIQGSHPGDSGVSALEYFMGGMATVPDDRGIFLSQSWRMHPDVCKFISDAVYDGRLVSSESAAQQSLIIPEDQKKVVALKTGLQVTEVSHTGNAQRSEEEAAVLLEIYSSLLQCEWRDSTGKQQRVTPQDILVVSPYNMQVDLLRRTLPEGALVGTVDKFQGQQAVAVLISMATSSADDLRRQIEFLYSKNRLNVAVSRSRCLAVLVTSPRLFEVNCATIHQMQLANILCWAKAYSDQLMGRC